MSITLTPAETAVIQQQARSEDALPSYYNSDLQAYVQISRDFESFLILSPAELKTKAISWIKQASTIQTVNKDRDALTKLAAEQEAYNAQQKTDALNLILENFSSFRATFQTNSDFAAIAEVQRFLLDLQKVVAELAQEQDRAQFDATMSQVMLLELDKVGINNLEVQELQSWNSVLSAYLQG